MSVRRVLWTAAASAGLSACAAMMPVADGCHYLASVQSASPRAVGGRNVICDANLIDAAVRIPHIDDYVLDNEMW